MTRNYQIQSEVNERLRGIEISIEQMLVKTRARDENCSSLLFASKSMEPISSSGWSGCFAALRQIQTVHRSRLPTTLEILVVLLVLTMLDYGNATLAAIHWLAGCVIAVKLVFHARRTSPRR